MQTGVPGLDSMYGVTPDGSADEPAGQGVGPVEEVWDTDAYLRHVPGALAEVSEHVGPDLALLHDAHHRLTPNQAARLGKAVEPVDLYWFEDVTPAENLDVSRLVRAQTTTPLAVGEEFQQLITEQLIDFVRAAVSHVGGITPLRRIAALAEVWQVRLAPHGPSDVSSIALAGATHVGLATPNFAIQEYMGYPDAAHEVFRHAWTADGHLHPGDTPGLGVDVDLALAARFPYERAYLPVARQCDGTLTDW